MKVIIYTLKDPITNEIRYVGRTRKSKLYNRLSEHMSMGKSNHNTYKKNWIKKLIKLNQKPIIEEVETLSCSWEQSHEAEKYWINQFISWGFKLVNLEDRGAGGYKRTVTHNLKPVLQYSLEGDFINEFVSIRDASRKTKTRSTTIEKVLWKICNTAGGFQWKYKTENFPVKIPPQTVHSRHKRRRIILQYTLNGDFIKEWNSVKSASEFLNISTSRINELLKDPNKRNKKFIFKLK
jgi:hypothetical protein